VVSAVTSNVTNPVTRSMRFIALALARRAIEVNPTQSLTDALAAVGYDEYGNPINEDET
jgi:hypothetical protein